MRIHPRSRRETQSGLDCPVDEGFFPPISVLHPEPPGASSMSVVPPSLLERRLIIVTGKGGVGKTSIACAVADAARRKGKRVLLVETAPVEAAAARFELKPMPVGYAGRTLRPGLHVMGMDPHEALAEYARLQIGLGLITDRVLKTQAFRELLDAAPGWRELISLGKIWQVEQRTERGGRPAYDLIVVDAPATGHGITFLDVPRVVQQAVRTGPLMRHASWVEELIHDRERTVMLPVTLAEELPVSETIELVARARTEIDLEIDRIVVNRMPEAPPTGLSASLARLPKDLAFKVLPEPTILAEFAGDAIARATHARHERSRVSTECGLPIVDVPVVPGGFGPEIDWSTQADLVLEPPSWPNAGNIGEDAA